ncbi:inverted formin-2 [Anaeramoeba flamelloides]|uniref:Inverted formin-2 n=1 Tax=Anaeramoeba flamelloides TaxID=1746091 RepID=A0AAV7Z6M5_9EUKA|nr:inverted formin-2 [Anaeramoeba flamelloides]
MSRFKKFLSKKNKGKNTASKISSVTKGGSLIQEEKISIPPENELNSMFENLLTELGLPELTKKQMRQMEQEKKWVVLCQHKSKEELKKLEAESGKTSETTPKYFVEQLKTNLNSQTILSLRTALSSNPLSWIIEFLELGGFSLFMEGFSKSGHKDSKTKTRTDLEFECECIKSCKSIMNNNPGLEAFLSHKKYTIFLVLCLDWSKHWNYLKKVLELLTVISVVPPNGHRYCLEGLSYLREKRNFKSRFAVLTNHLKESIEEKESLEFQESCIMFINTLIETPQDPYVCFELRKEFAVLGIRRILSKINVEKSKGLANQIEMFYQGWKRDEEKTRETIQDIPERDEQNLELVFQLLCENMMKSDDREDFLKILNKFCDASFDSTLTVWPKLDLLTSRVIEIDLEKDGASAQDLLFGLNEEENSKQVKELENFIIRQKNEIQKFDKTISLVIKSASKKMNELSQIIKRQKDIIKKLIVDEEDNSNNLEESQIEKKELNEKEKEIIKLKNQFELLIKEREGIEQKNLIIENEINDQSTRELIVNLNEKIIHLNNEIETYNQTIKVHSTDSMTYQETILSLNNDYKSLQKDVETLENQIEEMEKTGVVPKSYREKEYEEVENESDEEREYKIKIKELKGEKSVREKQLNEVKELLGKELKKTEELEIELNDKLNLIKKENENIINDISEIKKLTNDNDGNENGKKELNENGKEPEMEIKKKEGEIDIEIKKINNLENQIEKLENDCKGFQRVLNNVKTKYDEEIIELNNKISNIENYNQKLVNEWGNKIKQIKEETKQEINKCEETYNNEKEEYMNEIHKLTNQLFEFKSEIENYKNTIELLKESYQKQIHSLKQESNSISMTNEEFEHAIQLLKKEKENLDEKLNKLKEIFKNQKKIDEQKIENLRRIINDQESETEKSKRTLKNWGGKIHEFELDSKAYQLTITNMKENYEKEMENLLIKVDNLRIEYDQKLKEHNENSNTITVNDQNQEGSSNNSQIEKGKNFQQELNEQQIELEKLEIQNNKEEKKINNVKKQIDLINKEINQLNNTNEQLKKNLEKVKINKKEQKTELENKIQNLQSQIKDLQNKNKKNENNDLNGNVTDGNNNENNNSNNNNFNNNTGMTETERTKIINLENQVRKLEGQLSNENSLGKLNISTTKSKYESGIEISNKKLKTLQNTLKEMNKLIIEERKTLSDKLKVSIDKSMNENNNNNDNNNNNNLINTKEEEKNEQIIEYENRIENLTKQIEKYNQLQIKQQKEINELKKNFEKKMNQISNNKESDLNANNNDNLKGGSGISSNRRMISNNLARNRINKRIIKPRMPGRNRRSNRGFMAQRREFENIIKKLEEENKELKSQIKKKNPKQNPKQNQIINTDFLENESSNLIKTGNQKKQNINIIQKVNKPPSKPMKILPWNKYNINQIENTIWKEINNDIDNNENDINTQEIEGLFNNNAIVSNNKTTNNNNPNIIKSLNILKETKFKNIEKMFNNLQISFLAIKNSILDLDEEALTVDNLKELLITSPTKLEFELLEQYRGLKSLRLSKPEQFLLDIIDIPRYKIKIRSWICKRTFQSKMDYVVKMIKNLSLACNELQSSGTLKQILKVILTIGNYLNGGTYRGNASGFKLSTLSKLYHVKGNNTKSPNLLHFIAKLIGENGISAQQLINEIPHVKDASSVSFKSIKKNFQQIGKDLKLIQLEIIDCQNEQDSDSFRDKMRSFLNFSIKEYKSMAKRISESESIFNQTVGFFAEDLTIQPNEFFAPILDFSNKLQNILNKNSSQKSSSTFHQANTDVGLVEGIIKSIKSGAQMRGEN